MTDERSDVQLILASHAYEMALDRSVDPVLVWAVVRQESAEQMWAYRYEPGWRWFTDRDGQALGVGRGEAKEILGPTEFHAQSASWGLMQCMGTVLRELGYTEPMLPRILVQPRLQLYFGCLKLGQLLQKYGGSVQDALSAYNDGDDYRDHDNPKYVNGVLEHRAQIMREKELLAVLRGDRRPSESCAL